MKRLLIGSMAAMCVGSFAFGGMNVHELEKAHAQMEQSMEHSHAHLPYYVVIKGMTALGDDVRHGEAMLEGDQGYGFGIDFGYRFAEGFAIELDYSYETDDIIERREGEEPRTIDGKYHTVALDLVYTYDISDMVGLFVKAGYEHEWEKVDDLGIDTDEGGAVFGVGTEVGITHAMKFVAEYEHSTIDGPRGDAIFAGLMFEF